MAHKALLKAIDRNKRIVAIETPLARGGKPVRLLEWRMRARSETLSERTDPTFAPCSESE